MFRFCVYKRVVPCVCVWLTFPTSCWQRRPCVLIHHILSPLVALLHVEPLRSFGVPRPRHSLRAVCNRYTTGRPPLNCQLTPPTRTPPAPHLSHPIFPAHTQNSLVEALLPTLGFAHTAVVASSGGRGPALRRAARASSAGALLLLHADTRLVRGFDRLVTGRLYSGDEGRGQGRRRVLATAFRFALDPDRFGEGGAVPGVRVMERTVHVRSWLWQLPFGDQAIAIRSDVLRLIGGLPDVPIMEDFIMVQKLRQLHARGLGRIHVFEDAAYCSPRRWMTNGVWKTNLVNQAVMLWYTQGGGDV